MPCDSQTLQGQTISERKQEVRGTIERLSQLLASGSVRIKVASNGAIVFIGWQAADRGRISDACAFRLTMVFGSAIAKAKVAQAEALAGRSVDRRVLAGGVHSHDGGKTWHHGH